MQVHFGVELLKAEWSRSIACVGTFDGVHLGHQAVIRCAVNRARERGLPCCLVTFDRHPSSILAPSQCPKAIAPLSANLAEFAALGVSVAVVLPFDAQLSRMTATKFLDKILKGALRADSLVVGHDFALGQGREGTTDWLAMRLATEVVPALQLDGIRVSSTRIREAVKAGDLRSANRLLGRRFDIPGVVVLGDQIGRTLGFPTANLAKSFDQVRPGDGIYASRLSCAFGTYDAATYVGTRPTVDGLKPTIESFILDYPGDSLYGHTVHVELVERVREDRMFESLDSLRTQMTLDVERVREVLKQEPAPLSAN